MRRRQDGQAVLEAALILPLLLLLVFGVAVFGILVNTKLAVAGASREAGRNYAIRQDPNQAQQIAQEYTATGMLAGAPNMTCRLYQGAIATTPPPDLCAVELSARNGFVTVRVTFRQQTFVGGLLGLPARVPVSGMATFRLER